MIYFILALILAYFLGSIPTAYVIGKAVKGIDIREHGSGNVGASNVFRVVGKKWGILVFVLDVLKGFIPVKILAPFFYHTAPVLSPVFYAFLLGIAAIFGHNWTVFLNFKGGKGVATSLGVGLGLVPKAALSAFALWGLVLIPFGYISIASIAAALSFPCWVYGFYREIEGFWVIWTICLVLALLIVYKHRSNMARLLAGTERKVWDKKK